jgi:hypothetical protein
MNIYVKKYGNTKHKYPCSRMFSCYECQLINEYETTITYNLTEDQIDILSLKIQENTDDLEARNRESFRQQKLEQKLEENIRKEKRRKEKRRKEKRRKMYYYVI